MITTELLIIFFLLLLNGFFAMSEMAIVSASRPLLRQQAKQGSKGAEVALSLAEDSGRFLSTVQVGITLVGIIAGAYGGATIAEKLAEPLNAIPFINPNGETVAVVAVVALITFFSVVMGELIPKQVALNRPERIAVLISRPMALLSRICTPVVIILEGSARLAMALLRVRKAEETMTETEIKAVIAEGAASGAIEQDEHDMLRRVIRLGDRDVQSIMTHRIDMVALDINDTLEQVKAKIGAAGHSRYPVIDRDPARVLGVVQTKDLLEGVLAPDTFRLADYMKEAVFVPETMPCTKALAWFKTHKVHLAIVVDETSSTAGIFTVADMMEAIVGLLPSNYNDAEEPMIFRREDGSWLIDGLTPVDELHLSLGLEEIITKGEYQTVAGFMLHGLKKNPAVGDHFDYSGYRFEIVDMDRRRIDKIIVTPQAAGEGKS